MRALIPIIALILLGTSISDLSAEPIPLWHNLLQPADHGIGANETIRIESRWDAGGYEITPDFSALDGGQGDSLSIEDTSTGNYVIVYTTGPMTGLSESASILIPIQAVDPLDGTTRTDSVLTVCRRHLTPLPEHVSTMILGGSDQLKPGDDLTVLSRWRTDFSHDFEIVADYSELVFDFQESEAFVDTCCGSGETITFLITYGIPGVSRLGEDRADVPLTIVARDSLCTEMRSPELLVDVRIEQAPIPIEHRIVLPVDRGVRDNDTVVIFSRWNAGGYDLSADFTDLDGGAGGAVAVLDSSLIDPSSAGSYVIRYTPGPMAHLPDGRVAVSITAVDSTGNAFTDNSLEICRNHYSLPPVHLESWIRGGRERFRTTDSLVVVSRWSSPSGIGLTVEGDYRNLVPGFKPEDAPIARRGVDTFLVLYAIPFGEPLVPDGEGIPITVLARDSLCSVTRYDSIFVTLDTQPPESPPTFDPIPSQTNVSPIPFSGFAPGAVAVNILLNDDPYRAVEVDSNFRFETEVDLVQGSNKIGGYSEDDVGNLTILGTSQIILYVLDRGTTYPTPFRKGDEIVVQDGGGLSHTTVQVYNLEGDVVTHFESRETGLEVRFMWNGEDIDGNPAQPGYYMIRVRYVTAAGKTHEDLLPMLYRNDG